MTEINLGGDFMAPEGHGLAATNTTGSVSEMNVSGHYAQDPTMCEIPAAKIFDARTISCATKHQLIFSRWAETAVGEFFVLLNDHRPTPLRAQFEQVAAGMFQWTELVSRPGLFAVRIERTASPEENEMAAAASASVSDAEILAWITFDAERNASAVTNARILRLARTLSRWTGLLVDTAHDLPDLVRDLELAGFRVTTESREGRALRYSVRLPSP